MEAARKYSLNEQLFLILWTAYAFCHIVLSSEVQYTFNVSSFLRCFDYFLVIAQVVVLFMTRRYEIKDVIKYATFLAVIFIIELSITSYSFLITVLFIIMAQHVDFDKLIRYDIKLKSIFLFIIVSLCLLGITDNYSDIINGTYKQSFGFAHPNTFCAYVFTVLLEYLCIRYKKMKPFEWIGILAISLLIMHLGGGRTSGYTFMLILALYFLANYIPKLFYSRLSKISFAFITPLMTVLSFTFSWMYKNGNSFAVWLNSFMTGRLSSINRFADQYGFKLFGQEAEFVSTRASNLTGSPAAILDNAYAWIAVSWGIIFLLIVVILYSHLFHRLLKYKRVDIALVGLYFVIMGLGEGHFYNVMYNLTFLYLLGFKSVPQRQPCRLKQNQVSETERSYG